MTCRTSTWSWSGVGGGGLISGVASAVKARRPSARVVGIEPERSNAVSLAIERGEVVTIQPQSVADGLGAPFAGRWTMAIARRLLDGIVLLDDPTILAGMRFAVERLKQVVEPAGAAALAAVLAGRVPIADGERVVVVISGGNVEVGRLGELLAGAGRSRARPHRPSRRGGLVDAEVVEALVVDAEVMCQLVHHGEPDLLRERIGIGEVGLERQAEQGDPVRDGDPIGGVLRACDALIQPVQRVVGTELAVAKLLPRGLVLDHDRDLVERGGERHRDAAERLSDEIFEPPVPALWARADRPSRS